MNRFRFRARGRFTWTTLRIAVVALGLGIGCPAWPAPPLKVLTYNVWYGFTKDVPNRRANVQSWIKAQAPDVVALQELNEYTPEKLAEDAGHWGHEHAVLLKQEGFPTGLTSSAPISNVVRRLEGFHHGLLRAETHGLVVYVIHLHPSNWEVRVREMERILEDFYTLPIARQDRTLLLGDFNTFSSTESGAMRRNHEALIEFFAERDRRFGEKNLADAPRRHPPYRFDQQVGSLLYRHGFVDLVHRLGPRPMIGTFPTKLRQHENHGTDRRLDYIFACAELGDAAVSAKVVDDGATQTLSDHLPVMAEIQMGDIGKYRTPDAGPLATNEVMARLRFECYTDRFGLDLDEDLEAFVREYRNTVPADPRRVVGFVYRILDPPELRGKLFFSHYCGQPGGGIYSRPGKTYEWRAPRKDLESGVGFCNRGPWLMRPVPSVGRQP